MIIDIQARLAYQYAEQALSVSVRLGTQLTAVRGENFIAVRRSRQLCQSLVIHHRPPVTLTTKPVTTELGRDQSSHAISLLRQTMAYFSHSPARPALTEVPVQSRWAASIGMPDAV